MLFFVFDCLNVSVCSLGDWWIFQAVVSTLQEVHSWCVSCVQRELWIVWVRIGWVVTKEGERKGWMFCCVQSIDM